MAKGVEFEFVQYRTGEMKHAASALVKNFAVYSGIVGTELWLTLMGDLSKIIDNQLPYECLWKTSALDVLFSGFTDPIPIINEGRVIFSPKEPRFIFQEKMNPDVRPAVRTHVQRVTNAIVREMHDVYRMDVKKEPLTLTFPKEEYVRRVEVFNALLL